MSADLAAWGPGGLFVAALVAATLLPAQSEALLSTMILAGRWDPDLLVAIATVGNVLGSTINWALGRFLSHRRRARWFPASSAALAIAEKRFRRYGWPLLLLSWLPIVGDPLTVVAGVLRMRLLPFLTAVAIAKAGRYMILAALIGASQK